MASLTPPAVLRLLKRALVAAFWDGCIGTAKAAAYSALLSFFPLLAAAATILVQTRGEFVARMLQNGLSRIVPPGSEELVVQQFRVAGERPWTVLAVALFVSVWGASGMIKSLIEGFHAAYRVPHDRDILRQSGVAMLLVLACGVPLLVSSAVIIFGGIFLELAIVAWIQGDPLLAPWSSEWRLGEPGGPIHRGRSPRPPWLPPPYIISVRTASSAGASSGRARFWQPGSGCWPARDSPGTRANSRIRRMDA